MLQSAPTPVRETFAAPAPGSPGAYALDYVACKPGRSRALHWWAIAALLAMFPLIWFGGLTTSHGAGMSVPDWPNTYGYNMFAVPWDVWLGDRAGGIFFEHTHRLLGSLVGFFALSATLFAWGASAGELRRRLFGIATIVLAGLALLSFALMRLDVGGMNRTFGHFVSGFAGLAATAFIAWIARCPEPRQWVRWTTTALLLAVCVQGLLGGLRVTAVNLDLAIVHGIFAQLTLCLAGFLTLATSRTWTVKPRAGSPRPVTFPNGVRFTRATIVLTALVVGQLVVATCMRHYGAGMAVPDFPLSYGHVLPPVSEDGLARANDSRVFDYELPPTTLSAVWLHTTHRIGAVFVTLGVAWVVLKMGRIARQGRPAKHVWGIVGLLGTQICLGVATVWLNKPADVTTGHVAVGALMLLSCWLLTVRAVRLYGWRPATAALPLSAQLPSAVVERPDPLPEMVTA